MRLRIGKHFRRKFMHTLKKGGSIIRKSGNVAKSIIGKVDKFSGGALTKALQSDPRGQALLTGVNMVSDK